MKVVSNLSWVRLTCFVFVCFGQWSCAGALIVGNMSRAHASSSSDSAPAPLCNLRAEQWHTVVKHLSPERMFKNRTRPQRDEVKYFGI